MEKKQVFIMLGIVVAVTIAFVGYCLLYGNQYTIKFDSNGGTEVEKQIIRVGDKVKEPEAPVREGYQFVEWQFGGKKFDFNTKIRKNMVLVAQWQKVSDAAEIFYIVTFDSNGGSEVEEQYIAVGKTVTKPTNPVKKGYIFKGWYYNGTKFDFSKKVSQDITLIAKWKSKSNKTDKDKNSNNGSALNNDLKVGDRVRIIGSYASSSSADESGAIHTRAIGWKRVILKIYDGSEYPYRVGNETGTTGFFKAESLEKIG